MYRALSEDRVFEAIRSLWPVFDTFMSFDQLLDNGWITNELFNNNIPYVWRSNRRIREERFWNMFEKAFANIDEIDGFILFHEKHAGWKRRMKSIQNGVFFQQLVDASDFMKDLAFYSRRQWQYGEINDNYNLLLIHSKIFVSFTHEGEFLCFSKDKSLLITIARSFHSEHLVCKFEDA